MLVEIIIFLLSILVFKAVLDHTLRPRNLPPGPCTLPFLGNIHQLGKPDQFFSTLTKWSRKFGPVFTFFVGSGRYVVINSIEAAKEALIRRGTDFAGRPPSYIGKLLSRGGKNISLQAFSATWKKHRKLLHRALYKYTGRRLELEEIVCKEINELCTSIDGFNGSPVDPKREVLLAVLNIKSILVFGSRCESNHPDIKKIDELVNLFVSILSEGRVLNNFPILRYLPLTINEKIEKFDVLAEEIVGRRYREHMDTFQDGQTRDYTDALIQAAKVDAEKGDLESQGLTEDYIVMVLFDVFGAGTELVTTTLRWLLLYMVAYPELQAKVHEELDTVVGRDRLPELQDRDELVYLQAVIKEILRDVTPATSLPHYTIVDTSVGGYSIPKDTTVIMNHFAIHHDPDKWENPDEFNPSRFIDQDNKLKSSADLRFLPFSAGQRGCPGEDFARTLLVLIFSRLMHRYRVERPPGAAQPDLQRIVTQVTKPKYNEMCFKTRVN